MGLFLGILALVGMIMMWTILGVLMVVYFFCFFGLPYAIFEGICYCTVNNIINVIAKIPIIGWLIAFCLSCCVSIVTLSVSLYCGFLCVFGPALWCFTGIPGGKAELIASNTGTLEPFYIFGINVNPAYWFMNYFEWIYKYSGITHSIFPWLDVKDVLNEGGLFIFILKMTFMALPYLLIFAIPLLFIIWNFTRPIVGAIGRLPAIVVIDDD